jgi:FtsP/CotA-like multicopper oxidase with cupredoxin domain
MPLLAGLVAVVCSGCGSANAPAPLPLQRLLSADAKTKTATLSLIAAYNDAYGGFNFDGYGKGQVLVEIPKGWRVEINCTNNAADVRHSCAVVHGVSATSPAFPGWASEHPTLGLAPHSSTSFSFVATRTGSFRIACLVPNHETAGMWDVLDVTRIGLPRAVLLRR